MLSAVGPFGTYGDCCARPATPLAADLPPLPAVVEAVLAKNRARDYSTPTGIHGKPVRPRPNLQGIGSEDGFHGFATRRYL